MSKFTKKELYKLSARHQFGLQLGHNYARMQGLGYYYSIYPALEKIYKDDPEGLDKSCRTHVGYYNTTPQMSEIIMGMNVAIEEEQKTEGLETVVALKTGLMGPFAAFGAVIFSTTSGTIFGAIAGEMALNNSIAGMLIWMVWYLFVIGLRFKLFELGYKQGVNLVTKMSDKLDAITRGAGIVGLMVVASLITSVIKLKIGIDFNIGEVAVSLQNYLDGICLYLPQIGFVGFIYYLSGKKNMTTTKLIFLVMIVAFVLAYFGLITQ